jgi:hypothetical protein
MLVFSGCDPNRTYSDEEVKGLKQKTLKKIFNVTYESEELPSPFRPGKCIYGDGDR